MRVKGFAVVFVAGVVGALSLQAPAAAQQDFQGLTEWTTPLNLGPQVNTAAEESAPAISDDGLSL